MTFYKDTAPIQLSPGSSASDLESPLIDMMGKKHESTSSADHSSSGTHTNHWTNRKQGLKREAQEWMSGLDADVAMEANRHGPSEFSPPVHIILSAAVGRWYSYFCPKG